MEVRACMRYLIENPQPSYLRLGKAGEQCLHKEVPKIWPGQWLFLTERNENQKLTLLCTGATLPLGKEWVDSNQEFSGYQLCSLPLWGMKYKNVQPLQISQCDRLVTIEDHLVDGGFGSWMLESAIGSPHLLPKINIKALDSKVCGMVGTQSVLNSIGGLN